MKTKLTSFYIPAVMAFFENEILNATGLSRTAFHRQMLQYYFEKDIGIAASIFNLPQNGEAKVKEQIYLDNEDVKVLNEYIAIYNKTHIKICSVTNVLTQALVLYCVHMGIKLLDEKADDNVGIATGILYVMNEQLVDF